MNDALIKEARKDAKVYKGLAVGDLLGRLADALEVTEKHRRARVWDEGYIAAEWNYEEVCNCAAWNMDECACGNYGNGHHRKENPYKTRT